MEYWYPSSSSLFKGNWEKERAGMSNAGDISPVVGKKYTEGLGFVNNVHGMSCQENIHS